MRLVDDWKEGWRWASVQISTFAAILFGFGPDLIASWGALPSDLKLALPEGTARWVSSIAFVLVIIGRLTTKKPKYD